MLLALAGAPMKGENYCVKIEAGRVGADRENQTRVRLVSKPDEGRLRDMPSLTVGLDTGRLLISLRR
jgi:hypothetical protein